MKESPLILYIVHFIVCVTVMVMVSLEIRKYGTQDMLLCAFKMVFTYCGDRFGVLFG